MSILKKSLSLILCVAMLTCTLTACLTPTTGILVDTAVKNNQTNLGPSSTIAISDDGYWVINGTKTAYKAVGENGKDGVTPTISINEDGYWVINGSVSQHRAVGQDGVSPTVEISNDGYWVLNGTKSAHKATGTNGKDGKDGQDGANGITPRLQINAQTNEWEVSYDEGKSWESLGVKASSSSESATIQTVEFNQQGQLVITMTSGQVFVADLPTQEAHIHNYGERQDFTNNAWLPCDQRIYFHVCADCNEMKWVYGKSDDHSFSGEYVYDTDNHWKVCVNCNQVTTTPEAHTMNEKDTCTVCGLQGKYPVFNMDLGGREFVILSYGNTQDIYVDSSDLTSPLSSALYSRTKSTEERMNAVITVEHITNSTEAIQRIQVDHAAGMNSYDLISGYSNATQKLMINGYYSNLRDKEYFVDEADYWSQSLVQNLTVNDRLFSVTGDISLDYMDQASVIFFNKEMANHYALEDLYETVLNGEWTIEKMRELAECAYTDMNANSIADLGDCFGLLLNNNTPRIDFFTAAGISLISEDAVLMSPDEKFLNFYDSLTGHFNSITTFSISNYTDLLEQFANGNGLFLADRLRMATNLHSNDFDLNFGFLPMPKYDMDQAEYRTHSHFYQLWSIPTQVDLESSAAILTSLAFDSNKYVLESHFEQILGKKFENTDSQSQILTLIYDSIDITMDSVYVVDMKLSNLYRQIFSGNETPTSWWAQNEEILKDTFNSILNRYNN